MNSSPESWWGAAAGFACGAGLAHMDVVGGFGGAGVMAVVAACFIKMLDSLDV